MFIGRSKRDADLGSGRRESLPAAAQLPPQISGQLPEERLAIRILNGDDAGSRRNKADRVSMQKPRWPVRSAASFPSRQRDRERCLYGASSRVSHLQPSRQASRHERQKNHIEYNQSVLILIADIPADMAFPLQWASSETSRSKHSWRERTKRWKPP